jgi:hypothetical protein
MTDMYSIIGGSLGVVIGYSYGMTQQHANYVTIRNVRELNYGYVAYGCFLGTIAGMAYGKCMTM